jgi:hypothetical protein
MSWLISKAMMKDYESLRSSQGLVEEYSEECSLGGEQSALLKITNMPAMYLLHGKTTELSLLSRFGMMCELLTESRGAELLTWFQQVFHASHSVMKEKGIGKQVIKIFGPKQEELFPKSHHNSFCLKMCQEYANICQWSSETCEELAIPSNDLPLLRRVAPERYKSESVSGYLPSCTARDGSGSGTKSARRRGRGCKHGLNLRDWFRTFYNLVYPPVVIEEYMMQWPEGWTDLKPLEMDKFQQWLDLHGRH